MNVNLILENLFLMKKLPFVALEKLSIAITLPKGLFICCCFSFGCSLCVWMCFLNSSIQSKNHVNVPAHKIELLWSISLWAILQKDDIKRAKGLDIKVGFHYEKAPEACIEELCDAVRTNITSGSCDQQHPRLFGHFEGTFLSISETQLVGRGLWMWEWRQQLIWLCGGQPHSPALSYYWLSLPHINLPNIPNRRPNWGTAM